MKTKAAFKSFLGLAVATSFLAGSMAQAQMKTSVAPRKAGATSQLKAKVKPAAPAKEEAKSPFGLNLAGTFYGNPKNEDNYVETWITGSVDLMENVSLSLETGIDSKFEKQEENTAYDLEAVLMVSGIEIVKDLKFSTGLIGVAATSRASRDKNMAGAWGAKANLGYKIGSVSLGLDNNFYQMGYKEAPVATPDEELTLSGEEKRFYSNEVTRATTTPSISFPLIGELKWKNELRIRESTKYTGETKFPIRYRTRLIYGITEGLTALGGVSWQKDMRDPKSKTFFDDENRLIWLQLSLDV